MTDMTAAVRRDRAVLVIAITVLTVLAWAYLLHLAAQMRPSEMMPTPADGAMGGLSMPARFVTGYLSIWVLFSLAATTGQWTLTKLALLTPMMASTSSVLGGILLIAAGLYQWSPLKRACLRHCQTPLNFLMQCGGFRPSPLGAVSLGARHGLHCVGCCALLMTLLFVGGVMNLLWIGGLSILVLLEKVWTKALVTHVIGALMVAGGVFLLVHPR